MNRESTDEVDSSSSGATSAALRPRKTAGDYLALAISTCGVGQALTASAWARRVTLLQVWTPQMAFMLVVIFLVTMAGIWAATRAERLFRKEDPSEVVIDEVAGQMIALLSGPFWLHTWWSVLKAFLLFRAFDIWKPYPIRQLENLDSGLGIMADDLAA